MHCQLKRLVLPTLVSLGLLSAETLAKELAEISNNNNKNSPSSNLADGENFILAIDGGGIRGAIPGQLLARIEGYLESKYKRRIRLASLFNIISGTSTGGLITLSLTTPENENSRDNRLKAAEGKKGKGSIDNKANEKGEEEESVPLGYSAETIVNLYRNPENAQKIFPGSAKKITSLKSIFGDRYDPKSLEKLLDEYFYKSELQQAATRIIVTTHELATNLPYIFDSEDADTPANNYYMKDVARATSAAPTYFAAAKIKNQKGEERVFVDGGLTLNNPAEVAFERARKSGAKKFFIVSLGTGETPTKNILDLENGGGLAWANPLISLTMSAASRVVDKRLQSEKERARENGLEIEYLRIQPTIDPEDKGMDDTHENTIKTLVGHANSIFEGNGGENSVKCQLLIKRLEERLAEQGIVPPGALPSKIYRQILGLLRKNKLVLTSYEEKDGEKTEKIEVNTSLIKGIIRTLKEENIEKFSTLKLLSTNIDQDAIPLIVREILKPYKVRRLVLDGSKKIGRAGVQQLITLIKQFSGDKEDKLALTKLSLQNLGIADKEAHDFGGLLEKGSTNLKEIRLGKNKISNEVIDELSDETRIRFKDLSDSFSSEDEEVKVKKLEEDKRGEKRGEKKDKKSKRPKKSKQEIEINQKQSSNQQDEELAVESEKKAEGEK